MIATPPRRVLLLTGLAAVLGLLGGGAAWVLLHLIALITNLAFTGHIAWTVPSFTELVLGPRLFLVAMAGALVISVIAKWAPQIRGHGIPEAMEAVLVRQSRVRPRLAIAKPLSAAIAIGTGGPFGAEGPIIVTGGAIGSLIGQLIDVSPSERKILLASGAAAGMAATFGAPLAAVVLAIELLLFEFSTRAFVPLVVASSIAAGVHSWLFGSGPLFAVPAHHYAGLQKLPAFAALGLGCGLLAALVIHGLNLTEDLFERLPIGDFWHPVIGAVGFASIGLAVPRALGVGYDVIGDTLAGRIATAGLAVLLVAKLVSWWIAISSGTSGGTLAPLLLIGGAFGGLFGSGADRLFPHAGFTTGAFALVAMAATFGAATRATFASIIFLFELTQDYQIVLPLMIATVLADLVTRALSKDSVLTQKLTRRDIRVTKQYTVDQLASTLVREVMTSEVVTLSASMSVSEARERFSAGIHSAYPLVGDDGRLAGIVSRRDLMQPGVGDDEPVTEVASSDVVTVTPDDVLIVALHKMLEEHIEHVPVVADGGLVGICTRTDLMRARRRQLEHETRQPGWTARFAGR